MASVFIRNDGEIFVELIRTAVLCMVEIVVLDIFILIKTEIVVYTPFIALLHKRVQSVYYYQLRTILQQLTKVQ